MANTLLSIDMILNQILVEVKNRLVVANMVDRQLDAAVSGNDRNGSIKVRRPVYYQDVEGPDITGLIKDTQQATANLTLNRQPVVPLQFTQNELTLQMSDFSKRIISPAADRIAQSVETEIFDVASASFGNHVGTPGTPPTTTKSIGDASALLSDIGAPFGDRWGCYSPQAALGISDNLKTLFTQPVARDALSDSKMGRIHRIDLHESQSVARHTNGNFTTGSTPLVAGAGQETTYVLAGDAWSQTLNTDGWVFTVGTLTKGDHFTIDTLETTNRATNKGVGILQDFVVLADATSDGAGLMTVTISPPIITEGPYQTVSVNTGGTAVADGLAIVPKGTENAVVTHNVVAHQNALTLGFAMLEPPQGGQKFARSSLDGISMAITSDYDINTANNIWRVETLFGVLAQNPLLGVIHGG